MLTLEENAAQAETAEQMAAADKITVASFERRKPARRPLPEHLPRERLVYPVPVTETLELIPRQWKVIQHVREKLVCRACEAITQPPAPSHPIARGRAGPKLLAHVLFAKYGLHTCRSIAKATSTGAKASTSMSRRSQTGWAPPRQP